MSAIETFYEATPDTFGAPNRRSRVIKVSLVPYTFDSQGIKRTVEGFVADPSAGDVQWVRTTEGVFADLKSAKNYIIENNLPWRQTA